MRRMPFFVHPDCHNNTFLALRVYDEGKDYIYSEFFLSGMAVVMHLRFVSLCSAADTFLLV